MAAAAAAAILRFLLTSKHPPSSSSLSSIFTHFLHLHRNPRLSTPQTNPNPLPHSTFLRPFSSHSFPSIPRNTKVNFSLSDSSDSSDSDAETSNATAPVKEIDQSRLPPPFDPFNKGPTTEEPSNPKNLQEVFHKMRNDGGLLNNAVKMFDGLSKDGLTHEALELFRQIKDKGTIPDVVAYTAVLEAYANAGGHSKEAVMAFTRMLASGVAPNAYTYTVLIKGLARDGRVEEAKKYAVEMMGKGMSVNVGVYVDVVEVFVREGKEKEGREFVVVMREKGFVADEMKVREAMKGKRGPVVRCVMDLLFGE